MGLGEWSAAWGARRSRRQGAKELQWMAEAVDEADPEDDDEEAYLAGVRDALEWARTGLVTWESDRLHAAVLRRAGFDETGRHESERDDETVAR